MITVMNKETDDTFVCTGMWREDFDTLYMQENTPHSLFNEIYGIEQLDTVEDEHPKNKGVYWTRFKLPEPWTIL
jgi:hypothetical protein